MWARPFDKSYKKSLYSIVVKKNVRNMLRVHGSSVLTVTKWQIHEISYDQLHSNV